jgi:hypothetical protein
VSALGRAVAIPGRVIVLIALLAVIAAGGWLAVEATRTMAPSGSAAAARGAGATVHQNATFGYEVSLPPGWRRSDVLSYEKPHALLFLGREVFTTRSVDDENRLVTGGQTVLNPALDFIVEIEVRRNPDGLSSRQWATSARHSPQSVRQVVADTVVDRTPATTVTDNGYHSGVHYIARDGLMFIVAYRDVDPRLRPAGGDPAALQAVFRSFRFTR